MNEHFVGKIELISYFTGDIDENKRLSIGNHIAVCDQCRLFLDQLRNDKEKFLNKHPVPENRNNLNFIRFSVPKQFFALAASLILIVSAGLLLIRPEKITERIKGDTALELFVLNSAGTVEKRARHLYYSGERIQFSYSCAGNNYFALASIDQKGKISVYFPSDNAVSMRLVTGAGVPLPNSIVLDDYIGKELFVAFFSGNSFNISELTPVLQNAFSKTDIIDKIDIRLKGYDIEKILIEKK